MSILEAIVAAHRPCGEHYLADVTGRALRAVQATLADLQRAGMVRPAGVVLTRHWVATDRGRAAVSAAQEEIA